MFKLIAVVVGALLALVLAVAPASAEHLHSKEVRPGVCVVLAQNGNERYTKPHPIHTRVHRGRAGENFTIAVYGSADDPCADGRGRYLNVK